MTATCKLPQRIDLGALLQKERPLCWRNRGFDAVSLRLFLPEQGPVTALVYASGSVVFVGAKSVDQLEGAWQQLCVKCSSTSTALLIHNICFSFMLPRLNLNRVFQAFRNDAVLFCLSYDPELFPAITLTLRGTNKKASLFHTGRVNLIGCKTNEEADGLRVVLNERLLFYSLI